MCSNQWKILSIFDHIWSYLPFPCNISSAFASTQLWRVQVWHARLKILTSSWNHDEGTAKQHWAWRCSWCWWTKCKGHSMLLKLRPRSTHAFTLLCIFVAAQLNASLHWLQPCRRWRGQKDSNTVSVQYIIYILTILYNINVENCIKCNMMIYNVSSAILCNENPEISGRIWKIFNQVVGAEEVVPGQ